MPDSAEVKTSKPVAARRRLERLPFLIAIASSSILFACAGSCFLVNLLVRPRIVESPEGATEVASKITDWTLPDNFSGKVGMTFDFTVVQFSIATFQQRQGRGTLVIGEMNSSLPKARDQPVQTRELIERYSPELKRINLDQRESRTLTIRGLPAKFEIGRGEDRASTTKYRQVTGQFRGKSDDAILILQCEDDVMSDEQIDEFIKSIK